VADDPAADVFLWVHYQDPHGPYTPPEGLRERLLPAAREAEDGSRTLPAHETNGGLGGIPRYQVLGEHREVAFYRAGYDAEVVVTDREIGALLDGVAERGADPIVVFTADHGESLGEDDLWFVHGASLSEVQVRVPLILRVPGRPGERRPETASLLDVAPTLLALLDVPAPSSWSGRDLLAAPPGAAQSEVFLSTLRALERPIVALVADGHRAAWTREPGGGWSKTVRPLADPTGEVPAEVEAALNARLEQQLTRRPAVRPQAPAPTPAERERLRALGYLD
jgi:arylsulfatase A-like enzyme